MRNLQLSQGFVRQCPVAGGNDVVGKDAGAAEETRKHYVAPAVFNADGPPRPSRFGDGKNVGVARPIPGSMTIALAPGSSRLVEKCLSRFHICGAGLREAPSPCFWW